MPKAILNTADGLNGLYTRSNFFIRHLAQSLAADPKCPFSVQWPKYPLYCADFVLQNCHGHKIFVELKLGSCRTDKSQAPREGFLNVRHRLRHYQAKRGRHSYFDYTGGRWTFLITELDFEVSFASDSLPRTILLLHRSDIPHRWWHEDGDSVDFVSGSVPASARIAVDAQLAQRVTKLLEAVDGNGFGLPPLEPLDGIPMDELVSSSKLEWTSEDASGEMDDQNLDANGISNIQDDQDIDNEVELGQPVSTGASGARKSRRSNNALASHYFPDYVFQSSMSLLCMQQCLHSGTGLLYDHQPWTRGLKTFAFTAYAWNIDDADYIRARPLRVPKEIFELPQETRFVHLCFGRIRPWPSSTDWLFRPQTDSCLREMKRDTFADSKIMVFLPGHTIWQNARDRPVYAVPLLAFDHTKPEPPNHTRWRRLNLCPGKHLEMYRFDSIRELISNLSGEIKQRAVGDTDVSIYFRGHQVQTLARSQVFDLAASS